MVKVTLSPMALSRGGRQIQIDLDNEGIKGAGEVSKLKFDADYKNDVCHLIFSTADKIGDVPYIYHHQLIARFPINIFDLGLEQSTA